MQFLEIWMCIPLFFNEVLSMNCGMDTSPISNLYMGTANIGTYPWLGMLIYPRGKKKFTTSVVLVTKQMALASANEIDKLPKEHIRRLARVVLGNDCRGDSPYVGIREYTYHPDFFKDKVNALAMIQLETDHIAFKLHPICGPPVNFQNETFYTMMLADDCKKGEVWVYKMIYVPFDKCKHYYRKSGLDFDSLWPSHTTCAQSVMGDECVWRSGAILVTKVDQRWRLLGFGVYGPGCQAPARFLDYGMYHKWVKDSFRNIGRTAVSTIAENHLVMRRTTSKIQRFGACDGGEKIYEIFNDETIMKDETPGTYRYNLTLLGNIEYSCMDIQAQYISRRHTSRPKLTLRRWCAEQPNPVCLAGVQFIELFFYVEISFESGFKFRLSAYGEETKIIDSLRAHKYRNTKTHYPKRPKIRELWPVLKKLSATNLFYRKPNYKTSNNDNAIWITYGGKILYMETSP